MSYLGRIVGVGLSENGNPALIYAVTGRSSDSKKRVGNIIDDGFLKRVHINPLDKATAEQKKKAHIFFYDAIWTIPDIANGKPYGVVGNGVHTNTIANRSCASPFKPNSLIDALEYFGHEPDSLRTPRIAGELTIPYKLNKGANIKYIKGTLGIITEYNTGTFRLEDVLSPGKFVTLSTYSGENDDKPAAPIFDLCDEIIEKLSLSGTDAKDLAGSFYNKLDEKYRVISAAAIWDEKEWNLAVKNLHEVK